MTVYPGMENLKNYKGQQWHPVDGVLFFQTDDKKRQKMIDMYDAIASRLSDDERKKILDSLLDAWAEERVEDHDFNDCENN
jgi:hypothetical protein